MRVRWPSLLAGVLCWLLAGCGVPLQADPEAITIARRDSSVPGPPRGVLTATVYLVADGRLVPVERSTTELSPGALLLLLLEGATAAEAAAEVRSALVPRAIAPSTLEHGPVVRNGVIEVAVTDRFTSTSPEDQLLATAQLVWTLTEWSSAPLVRVLRDGEAIELPTDTGLSSEVVGRFDYVSVAPRQASAQTDA